MYVNVLNNINKMWDEVAPNLSITFRQRFESEKEAIIQELERCRDAVNKVKGNVDLTHEAKNRQITQIKATSKQRIDEAMERLIKLMNDQKAQLEKELIPEKPQNVDYGELMNLKADILMLLNSLEPGEALQRMGKFLQDYLVQGHTLGIWLLTATDWPSLYLESRKINIDEWKLIRDKILTQHGTEKQLNARNILQKLETVENIIKSLKFYVSVEFDSLR